MLMREYATEWWFVIPSLLTNVSALPGETRIPEIVSSVMLYTILENEMARREIYNICTVYFNNMILLSTENY